MLFEEVRTGLDPVAAFAALARDPYAFFLDSGLDVGGQGRYSFLGADPFLVVTGKGRSLRVRDAAGETTLVGDPFIHLETLLRAYAQPPVPGTPPLLAGAVGYLGYDLRHQVERLPTLGIDDLRLPDLAFGFYDTVLIFDHRDGRAYLSSTGLPERGVAASERARHRRDALLTRLQRAATAQVPPRPRPVSLQSSFTRAAYLHAVQRVKEYIAAGDIFQANLSQRFSAALPCEPWELYQRLRRQTPAPFAAYLALPECAVLSASPERFLRLSGSRVITRPIKGTRPRGRNAIEDARLADELRQSPKDRAELVMIVDLERNDLGRVCRFGSVAVPELLRLEAHPTVFHLVATVEGELREGCGHVECVRACFPGGSITGAPKVRAMEIIAELEPTWRGVYTGAIGYFGFHGETDLNIAIRTLVAHGGQAHFQVGGGIVADSHPEAEYQETLDKGRALIAALTEA